MKHMTTRELISTLTMLDPEGNKEILLAGDEEGNTFGFIGGTGDSFQLEENTIILFPVDTVTADEIDWGEEEEVSDDK